MRIRNVVHKGLRRFIEEDDSAGLQPGAVVKLRRMVSFLQDINARKSCGRYRAGRRIS
jgi:proteic killer suppression protein